MDDLMAKIQAVLSDEESMKQIMELAQMMGTDSGDDSPPSDDNSAVPPSDSNPEDSNANGDFPFDIGMLMQIGGLLRSANLNDKNADLILALKPHLSPERRERADKALKLLKLMALWAVVKESGLLEKFKPEVFL